MKTMTSTPKSADEFSALVKPLIGWQKLVKSFFFFFLTFPAELVAHNASTTSAVSANTTGSLGNLCSSQAGILSLLQGAAGNQSAANAATVASLNVTIPTNLSNSIATQQIAQVRVSQH